MKYLILAITLIFFGGSFFTLKNLYNGGQGKGAEKVFATSQSRQSQEILQL